MPKLSKHASEALLSALLMAAACTPALARPFHFTATSDMLDCSNGDPQRTTFRNVLSSIKKLGYGGNYGVFHIGVGDLDDSKIGGGMAANRARIDDVFGPRAVWVPGIGNHERETPADMQWQIDAGNAGNDPRAHRSVPSNQPCGTARHFWT
jgi:hypothetical protein